MKGDIRVIKRSGNSEPLDINKLHVMVEAACDGLAGVDGRGIDVRKAVEYIVGCQNFDGGYGATPGNESHAGQVFTCVAALQLAGALDKVDADLLCWWLAERQTASGGLNGRPEKLQDVCYSWWCLSSLSILKRLHWIDQDRLVEFILDCQDEIDGQQYHARENLSF